MSQSFILLARICSLILIITAINLTPVVFSAEQKDKQVHQPNNLPMIIHNSQNLDIVTINFLHSIEEAGALYDSRNYSPTDEIVVRVRLRDTFEEYFAVLIPLESKEGLEVTERSREVIQDAIAEFMESESQFNRLSETGFDLNAYSKVLTESMIYTAVTA